MILGTGALSTRPLSDPLSVIWVPPPALEAYPYEFAGALAANAVPGALVLLAYPDGAIVASNVTVQDVANPWGVQLFEPSIGQIAVSDPYDVVFLEII